jgi:ribonuclease E
MASVSKRKARRAAHFAALAAKAAAPVVEAKVVVPEPAPVVVPEPEPEVEVKPAEILTEDAVPTRTARTRRRRTPSTDSE